MKKILTILFVFEFFILLPMANAQVNQIPIRTSFMGDPLVREGDFAFSLANVLEIGKVSDESQAENMLATIGIAPMDGWIADFSITPGILNEIEDSVLVAADSGKLGMNAEDAVNVLNKVISGFGFCTCPAS